MTDALDLPEKWTPIARGNGRGGWIRLAGAVITAQEAKEMRDAGLLLTAQQRLTPGEPMTLVIKRVAKPKERVTPHRTAPSLARGNARRD